MHCELYILLCAVVLSLDIQFVLESAAPTITGTTRTSDELAVVRFQPVNSNPGQNYEVSYYIATNTSGAPDLVCMKDTIVRSVTQCTPELNDTCWHTASTESLPELNDTCKFTHTVLVDYVHQKEWGYIVTSMVPNICLYDYSWHGFCIRHVSFSWGMGLQCQIVD